MPARRYHFRLYSEWALLCNYEFILRAESIIVHVGWKFTFNIPFEKFSGKTCENYRSIIKTDRPYAYIADAPQIFALKVIVKSKA